VDSKARVYDQVIRAQNPMSEPNPVSGTAMVDARVTGATCEAFH
jgi:hypothetical protein